MNRIRRVGTLSSGVVMVVFGIVFLVRMALPWLDCRVIVSFWPLILIMLGAEMLWAYAFGGEDKVKYDVGAVVIILALCVFAMCMAGGEMLLDYMAGAAATGL